MSLEEESSATSLSVESESLIQDQTSSPVAPESSTEVESTENANGSNEETVTADDSSEEQPKPSGPPPSINDENAFPVLGASNGFKPVPVSWGPSSNGSTSPAPNAHANGSKPSAVARSKNVQEAFNISHLVSLNVSKVEFAKIINELKKIHQVSIESTLSSITKNRSFIVTGKPNDVAKVRKDLVRRLTKPISIRFSIPAKTRSAVIGSAGKNLKPIIESTATKINIDRNQTPEISSGDDSYDDLIEVSIEGDVDGVEEAKQSILRIVDEETKNLTTRINVPGKISAFVNSSEIEQESEGLTVAGPNKNGIITISGLRDLVLAKKAEINSSFETLSAKVKTEQKTIPKKVHQFINPSEILEKFKVFVELPTEETDELVTFSGLPQNINQAIQFARNTTSQFAIDSLDISKAHGGKIDHARALAAYFQNAGILQKIGEANNTKVSAPSYIKLASKDLKSVIIEITAPITASASIKQSRHEIIHHVNNTPPSRVRSINDILSLFAKKAVSSVQSIAKSENIYVFALTGTTTNEIILIALDKEDDEFTPSQEEIEARLNKVDEALAEIRELQADLKSVVLEVPSDKQQFIEGPKGTTLKAILKLLENSSIVVRLHNDGSVESDDKVFIQGSKADVAKVQKEIDSLLKDAEDVKDIYSFESESKVPTSILPRLIGKNGANLNEIREQFSVEVDVEKNPTGDKASLKIAGYKFNVKEAEVHIAQLVKRLADEITKTLIVPHKYRSSLIGANGQYVKKLQTKYNVRINFSSTNDEVVIRGPTRGATKAEQELKDLLDFEIENGYTKEIQVPQKAISRVIGRQGDTIKRIAAEAGIDINVESEDKENASETRTVTLSGSRKGLTEAEKEIKAIVEEVESSVTIELEIDPKYFRDILGPRGSVKQEIIEKAGGSENKDYRRLLQIPEQGSESNKIVSSGPKVIVDSIVAQINKIVQEKENAVTEQLDISKDKHRLLIGVAGSTRRELEDNFNVRINIPKASDSSNTISIIGSPENVTKAKARIDELTVDNWKAVVNVPAYLHSAVSERGAFTRDIRVNHDVEIDHGDLTNKAFKLSASIPTPPESAYGSAEESTKFTIVEDDSSITKNEDDVIPWRLKGEDAQVAEVEKLIKESLTKVKKHDSSGFLWVKTTSVLGKIVGPQGSRLNNIRRKSGAQIYIPRKNDKVNNVIFLRGDKEALQKAEKLILAEIGKK